MKFVYFLSGWEGSAADATMYAHSRLSDLTIPPGKFYLAEAGFGICDSLLVPLVFESLVRSGYLMPRGTNRD
jgi:hypothetical protein